VFRKSASYLCATLVIVDNAPRATKNRPASILIRLLLASTNLSILGAIANDDLTIALTGARLNTTLDSIKQAEKEAPRRSDPNPDLSGFSVSEI
jgi:hypothetical protein